MSKKTEVEPDLFVTQRNAEIMAALKTLKPVRLKEWMTFFAQDEDKLPYFAADVAENIDSAVRELCPPGYEIDR